MKRRDVHKQKIEHMLRKRDKLGMLEALISVHEDAPELDPEYLTDLKRRANELRNQLHVSSTRIVEYEF